MTFAIEKAAKLVSHYQFLKDKNFDNRPLGHTINHIVIAPERIERFPAFWNHYIKCFDNHQALRQYSYSPDRVLVMLVCHDGWRNFLFYNELDKFLTHNRLEKIYLTPGF